MKNVGQKAVASKNVVVVERVDEVNGWPLAVVRSPSGKEAPLVGHRAAAARLGYADPKDFLALADRVFGPSWKLRAPYAEFRDGARGPLAREYLWTRHQLIRLSMRCENAEADPIQEEIATVFGAWLDGHGQAPTMLPADLEKALAPLREEIQALRNAIANGTISAMQLDELRIKKAKLAAIYVALDRCRTLRAAHASIQHKIRQWSEWFGPLHLIPSMKWSRVADWLRVELSDVEHEVAKRRRQAKALKDVQRHVRQADWLVDEALRPKPN